MTSWFRAAGLAAAGTVCLLALSACYQDPEVTIFEPGVYKGARDPLLEKERSPQQQQRLKARFDLVQTDR
ncbi:MAG: hypothetical protein WCA32_04435 [Chromatiaceae bacterium]|jgi:hypothetical protein